MWIAAAVPAVLRGSWRRGRGHKGEAHTLGQLRPRDLEYPEHGMAGVKLGAGWEAR